MTTKEFLTAFNNGETVTSVSMGGMGDGYEFPIQDLAMQTLQKLHTKEVPKCDELFSKTVLKIRDSIADKLNEKYGYSGAQVGAAGNMAAVIWKNGYEKAINMAGCERLIKINKYGIVNEN